MTVGQLAEAIDVAFNGEAVSQVLEEGRSYDLVVRFPHELRANAEAIAGVMFDTPTGQKVPLSQLATITVDRGPNTISRENVQRKIVVQANVAGRDLGSTVADIQRGGGGAGARCRRATTSSTAGSSRARRRRRGRSACSRCSRSRRSS